MRDDSAASIRSERLAAVSPTPRYKAIDSTEYERAGNVTDIFAPTRGFSSFCGTTLFGSAKVFMAFKSEPVMVSKAITDAGVRSCHATSRFRDLFQIAIEHEKSGGFLFGVEGRHHVEIRDLAETR